MRHLIGVIEEEGEAREIVGLVEEGRRRRAVGVLQLLQLQLGEAAMAEDDDVGERRSSIRFI